MLRCGRRASRGHFPEFQDRFTGLGNDLRLAGIDSCGLIGTRIPFEQSKPLHLTINNRSDDFTFTLPKQRSRYIGNSTQLSHRFQGGPSPSLDCPILSCCSNLATVRGNSERHNRCFVREHRVQHRAYRRSGQGLNLPNANSTIGAHRHHGVAGRVEADGVLFGFTLSHRIQPFAGIHTPQLDGLVRARGRNHFPGWIEIDVVDCPLCPDKLRSNSPVSTDQIRTDLS